MSTARSFKPLLCVVDFHHARGPEIERWIGGAADIDSSVENDWSLIPYMALPDGAHTSAEEFSYFTLVYKAKQGIDVEATSVFGISCTQQLDSSELLFRPAEVTRSAVQKAVVAITDRPQGFSALREKLSVVTRAWFAQKDFRDIEILQHFQESLQQEHDAFDETDQFFGLSLREIVHAYKWQTLVLLKCLLLQPKMLFFGSNCEHVCQVQFSLLSLIPGLVRNLQDCAAPELDSYAAAIKKQDAVRTSDRASLLAYMGLPLQIFGKGSVFGPYTPLQQMDGLTHESVKSYALGTTNSLLLSQKERYCDVLVNLDEDVVQILSAGLKAGLTLTVADRRWIDFLTQSVNDTWDDSDPSRPSTHGYAGSEEFIRLQFEEYLLAMLSAAKYHQWLEKQGPSAKTDINGDPADEFSLHFISAWQGSGNYQLWNRVTDSQLFNIIEPRHPCAGGLTIDDVQRRLAAQVAELHLDERFSQTRDVVGRRLADGKTQVTTAFSKVWADIETMREAQRKKTEESRAHPHNGDEKSAAAQQLQYAQAGVQAAGQRASAYLTSWGAWANDKRKQGWPNRQ